MDEADIRMTIELSMEPRATFRDLSKALGLSVTAVHKRFRSLVDEGVFRRFTASPSPWAYGCPVCMIIGRFDPSQEEETLASLVSDERVHSVHIVSGDIIHMGAIARPGELIEDVKKELIAAAGIEDAFTDSMHPPRPSAKLEPEDHSIIAALQEDCRRPMQEVADLTGMGGKALRRRLDRMRQEELIWMRLDWSPLASGDHLAIINGQLADGRAAMDAVNDIRRWHMPPVVGLGAFVEHPRQLLMGVWARNLVDLHEARRDLKDRGLFSSLRYNLLSDMRDCDCWLDKVSSRSC